MIFTGIEIGGFRNLESASLAPGPGLNLLAGSNGAGKTSILEALHCLSTGHSFRTRKPRELINHAASHYSVAASFMVSADSGEHRAGLQRHQDGETRARLNFEEVRSLSTLTRQLPVKALTPDSHELIQAGPAHRRAFLDWGVYHDDPHFLDHWRVYRRTLQQRNQALRDQLSDGEVDSWNDQLVEAGEYIDHRRKQHLDSLLSDAAGMLSRFETPGTLSWSYKSGWPRDLSFGTALNQSRVACRRFKATTVGPHRADLHILIDDHMARQTLSRGQQKLLVYAMHLAQLYRARYLQQEPAVMLLDDSRSELDERRFMFLTDVIGDLGHQAFLTLNDANLVGMNERMFHVEHGCVELIGRSSRDVSSDR